LPADEPGRRFTEAREIFEHVATADHFEDFLAIPPREYID